MATLNINNDFVSQLANLYAASRPQFQAQQARPTIMPGATGKTTEGYADIGKSAGSALGAYIAAKYIKPYVDAERNKYMMENDPATQLAMAKAYEEQLNNMPDEQQGKIYSQPEFKAKMAQYAKLGYPIVMSEDGTLRFGKKMPVSTEAMKVDELTNRPPVDKNELLFSDEKKKISDASVNPAQKRYYETGAEVNEAQVKNLDEATRLMPQKSMYNAEDVYWARKGAQDEKERVKAENKERTERVSAAEKAYKKRIGDSQMSLLEGKITEPWRVALEDADAYEEYKSATSDIPETLPRRAEYAKLTINRLHGQFKELYERGADPKRLDLLDRKAKDIYNYYNYPDPRTNKIVNVLNDGVTERNVREMGYRTVYKFGKKTVPVAKKPGSGYHFYNPFSSKYD